MTIPIAARIYLINGVAFNVVKSDADLLIKTWDEIGDAFWIQDLQGTRHYVRKDKVVEVVM